MRFLIKYLAVLPLAFATAISAQDISPDQLIGAKPYESPSCNLKDHREFDFMHGTWDLKVMVNGKWVPGGFSVNTPALGGCALVDMVSYENWGDFYKPLSGRSGYAGLIISSYDKKEGNWMQVWHDDMGVANILRGRKFENGMRFVGHAPGANGAELQRLEWSITGQMLRRFTMDVSTDGGSDWTRIATVQMVRRPE